MTISQLSSDYKVYLAEQLIESIGKIEESGPNVVMYFTYGKCDEWADDTTPPTANCSVDSINEIWKNMIGGKRLFGGDVHHVIPRYNWTSGNTYVAYDHTITDLCSGNTPFYVVNNRYDVYKCLANNKNSPSTIEPTSTVPDLPYTELGDGYKWKYMYSINDSEKLRFTTSNYMAVKSLKADDGSLQWQIQQSAIPGAIHDIKIENSGLGYSNANSISVVIKGDGSDFSGYVVLSNTSIDKLVITNPGQDYTYANISLSGTGTTTASNIATFKAIISPPGGHGSDSLYELGGKNVIIDARLRYNEEGVLPTTNDYRQICLLKDPIVNMSANVAYIPAYLQATTLICEGVGNFSQDEIVYQGSDYDYANFKGRVLSWDPTSNKLLLINTDGVIIPQRQITGTTSQVVRIVATDALDGYLKPYSGKVLYVNNLKPITRSYDQLENFKIVLKF